MPSNHWLHAENGPVHDEKKQGIHHRKNEGQGQELSTSNLFFLSRL
jgi:hypothetical protein